MRASVLLLGAVLARCGEASLPMPGGDAIGLRGIDFHDAGLRAMGADVDIAGGIIHAKAPRGLHGAEIVLPPLPWMRRRTCCWPPCSRTAGLSSAMRHANPRLPT